MKQLRYVQQWTEKDGRQRIRFRRKGYPKIELPGPIDSEDFLLALREAAIFGRSSKASKILRAEIIELTEPCGVYLLLLNGKIVYVGASLDMKTRVADHQSNGRPFDMVFYIRTRPDQRHWLEHMLIRLLKPTQNRTRPRRASCK